MDIKGPLGCLIWLIYNELYYYSIFDLNKQKIQEKDIYKGVGFLVLRILWFKAFSVWSFELPKTVD